MTQIVLSINAGSSSVKVSIYTVKEKQEPKAVAEIQVNGLTDPPSKLTYTRGSECVCKNEKTPTVIQKQSAAFQYMLEYVIRDHRLEEVSDRNDIDLVCHRVVHGGDFKTSQLVTKETYDELSALTDLAPLHNGPALEIIQACVQELPSTRNMAVFDSQFHQSMPEHIRTYPIDPRVAQHNRLRKYGFHGISYAFVTRSVANYLNQPVQETNLILLHLGSGASACAVKHGQSWDTSMGLTPVAGLPGATRSGSVDPR